MKRLVAFPLEEGGNIVIEIDEPETGGTVRAGREDTIERAKETFEEALNKVLPATKTVVEKLRNMASKPDEIEVAFGVNLSTMAGAFIASADSTVAATGVITFENPPTSLSSALVVLSGELRSAAEVLRNSCAARSALPRSTLTEAGRGGLPQDPEATIPALYLAGREPEPMAPTAANPTTARVTRQGSLRLTMHCDGWSGP